MKRIKIVIYTSLLIIISSAKAQNKISVVRYEDDFSMLKNDTLKKGANRIKYIPMGSNKYISFGGELREQFQLYHNLNFGDVPPSYSKYNVTQLWHRLLMHTNIEIGSYFRFFIQTNSTLRFLNNNPVVPEIDENQVSLHQAFAELKLNQWKFRLGRQELFYGNHRLITVREGPNTRQAFDGMVIKRAFRNGTIDFLALSKVISKPYVFDDQSMKEGLIGIYGTHFFSNSKMGLDYFLTNFQSKLRKYNYRTGFENRQTYGIRFFSNHKTANFELEASYQTGKFNNLNVSAYSVLADVNILILPNKKGIMGVAAHTASGDKNPADSKLNTYNLLYAKPAYGLAAPIGATNMISFYPYFKINPIQKLNILAEVFFLKRNSNKDGTYSPGMIQNRPKPTALFNSDKKTLGQYYVLETNYQQSKNLSFSLDFSYLNAGSYPAATGNGKNITYVSFKSTFRL